MNTVGRPNGRSRNLYFKYGPKTACSILTTHVICETGLWGYGYDPTREIVQQQVENVLHALGKWVGSNMPAWFLEISGFDMEAKLSKDWKTYLVFFAVMRNQLLIKLLFHMPFLSLLNYLQDHIWVLTRHLCNTTLLNQSKLKIIWKWIIFLLTTGMCEIWINIFLIRKLVSNSGRLRLSRLLYTL